jgi:hypothetical protein
MSIVIEKGAIRSQIKGIDALPIDVAIYELIDDRKHSSSEKVFIDINLQNQTCIIAYSEEATKDDIDNTVKWFNTNKKQTEHDNIASRGIGLKFFEFRALGTWKHITKSVSSDKIVYYTSEINTYEIWNAEVDDKLSSRDFSEILHRGTIFVKEEDELPKTIENIFNNEDDKYPFKPKTIFRCNNLKNLNLLDDFKIGEVNFDFGNIIKGLKIKYYNEISKGLELHVKLPGYTEFKLIENDNTDVIGFTDIHNKINELKIDIFINSDSETNIDCHSKYYFEIGENRYKFQKNGNSIIGKKIVNTTNNKTPDFSLFQYNINNIEDKKNSIIGKSEETYAGLYIQIGDTFISQEPVEWNIIRRNLQGSKNYRAVLKCLSLESKYHLKLSTLKAQFNLATMPNFQLFIKNLINVYTKYISNEKSNDSDDYVIINRQSSKSSKNKNIDGLAGYFYIMELGENFFKFGHSTTHNRIYDYADPNTIKKYKTDFPDIIYHKIPHCNYLSITKIKNIKQLEEKIKTFINDSYDICQTYDCMIGGDIREYFICNEFDKLIISIKKEINKHIDE